MEIEHKISVFYKHIQIDMQNRNMYYCNANHIIYHASGGVHNLFSVRLQRLARLSRYPICHAVDYDSYHALTSHIKFQNNFTRCQQVDLT